jgi:hypothetical protein
MSPSFKGILSVILSVFFFFPWVWSDILHVRLSAITLLAIGLIVALVAVLLGFQARKGGARVWGIIGLTLGLISVVLNVVNLIAVSLASL